MQEIIREFHTLTDFIEYSETDQQQDASPSQRSSIQGTEQFTQSKDKAHAYHMLKFGYPEGTALMRRFLQEIEGQIHFPTLEQIIENQVEGAAPDIDAFIHGIPEDMFFFSSVERDAPPSEMTVQVEMACSSCVTKQTINLVGAMLLSASQALKQQGCAVTYILTYTAASRSHSQLWQSIIPLLPNLDLDTLAFMMTHPAVFRRMVFSAQEHESKSMREAFGFHRNGGYGHIMQRKIEQANVMLTLQQLSIQINHYSAQEQFKLAIAYIKQLVSTKFHTQLKSN